METAEANREQVRKNGFGVSMTSGKSMRPLIWGGRHCVVVAPLVGAAVVGDMLMFAERRAGAEICIVHRVVGVEEGVYITRGDNCLGTERVRAEDVIGRVVEVHRIGGRGPWYALGGEKFTVEDRAYLRYVRVWTALWPLRRVWYRVRGFGYRVYGALRHVWRGKSRPQS